MAGGHQGEGARLAAIRQQHQGAGVGDGARTVGDARLTNVKQIVLPVGKRPRRGQHRSPGAGGRDFGLPAAPMATGQMRHSLFIQPSGQIPGKGRLLDGEGLGMAGADPGEEALAPRAVILPTPGLPAMGGVGNGGGGTTQAT
ncbi:hypothetical protein D3C86_1518050 [compost metagenome]